MQVVEADDAPEGGRYLRLENLQAGRPAQLFQGFPVDGRVIGRVSFKLAVRSVGVGPGPGTGPAAEELPGLVVRFFNEQRTRSVNGRVGGWQVDGPWRRVEGAVTVPAWAREAIVQIGMFGATGRFEVDDVQITGISR
jgi:protein-L-isoaspartate(D-aspartate) O-methyltransferase